MFLSFTFNLAAQQLQPQAHPSRSGPLWVNPDKTGQQRLHGPQFRSVIIAVAFKYLAGKRARVIKISIDCYSPPNAGTLQQNYSYVLKMDTVGWLFWVGGQMKSKINK